MKEREVAGSSPGRGCFPLIGFFKLFFIIF
jgi:hypothetical protein